MFVSQASLDTGTVQSYGLRKRVEPVKNCRNISKADMKHNGTMPKMRVDPESYVRVFPGLLTYTCIANLLVTIDRRSRWNPLRGRTSG